MTGHRDASIGAVGQDVAAAMRARRAAVLPPRALAANVS